jgi:hypothetical protein
MTHGRRAIQRSHCFVMPMELAGLRSEKIFSKVGFGKYLSDVFPFQNGLQTMRCFTATNFQMLFTIGYRGRSKSNPGLC